MYDDYGDKHGNMSGHTEKRAASPHALPAYGASSPPSNAVVVVIQAVRVARVVLQRVHVCTNDLGVELCDLCHVIDSRKPSRHQGVTEDMLGGACEAKPFVRPGTSALLLMFRFAHKARNSNELIVCRLKRDF